MTALSADLEAKREDGEIVSYPVKGSAKIFKGALVVDLGTGYASPGADGSGYIFLGVALEKADNSGSATDGAINVRVYKTGTFEYSKASAAQTDLGTLMYIRDDQTVSSSTTNSISAGYVVDIPDSSHVKVRINIVVK